jgi:SAM-dependent methyltransferase
MMMEKKLDVNGLNSDSLATLDSILDFETADARKLAYGDESFELILEKGTLDAMLADKENGIKNCQTIIGECARVVKQGGFIVVVSHLNAHVQNGKEWLNQVVLAGLRAKSKNFRWEIEVHGNDGLDALLEAEEDGEALMDDNPGPCVYIIYKTGRCQEDPQDADPPSVPVRFYTY